jgi:hypothetical protein
MCETAGYAGNDPRAARGGVGAGGPALGSFGLTVRSVCESPSIRSELLEWLTPVGQRAEFFGLSQRGIMF